MKKTTKALLLTACALVLVIGSVFGTLAYLTSQDSVTNTFAVGNVAITLDEARVNEDGTYVENHDTRAKENKYHLLPGHTYSKDPTVTVTAGSEDAYVRMIVTVKNIDQLMRALPQTETIQGEDGTTSQVAYPENQKYYGEDDTFLLQMLCGGWDADTWLFEGYTEKADGTEGYYEFRYKEVVKKSETATKLDDLFETITVPGEIDNKHLAYLDDVEIVVNAHAIQADGFADANAAWTAFGEQQ